MKHDVRLLVETALPERLLSRALRAGAKFTRVERRDGQTLSLLCDAASARILLKVCKSCGLNARAQTLGAIPRLRRFLKRRWTVLAALLLCALLCALFLGRLWFIRVRFTGPGARLGNEALLRRHLEELDVRPGMALSALDVKRLEKQLAARAEDAGYVGLRRRGVCLFVEAAPEIPAPETHEIAAARDLVARRDGVVRAVRVYAGTACVQPGDVVRAGQLLIRGEERSGTDPETGEEITSPVRAMGEVIARCWFEGEAAGEIESKALLRSGNARTESHLSLPGFEVPLIRCEPFPTEETEVQTTPVVGLYLPLEVVKTIHYETLPAVQRADETRLRAALEALAAADCAKKLARSGLEYETASRWTLPERSAGALRVRAVTEIYADVAVSRGEGIEEVY